MADLWRKGLCNCWFNKLMIFVRKNWIILVIFYYATVYTYIVYPLLLVGYLHNLLKTYHNIDIIMVLASRTAIGYTGLCLETPQAIFYWQFVSPVLVCLLWEQLITNTRLCMKSSKIEAVFQGGRWQHRYVNPQAYGLVVVVWFARFEIFNDTE